MDKHLNCRHLLGNLTDYLDGELQKDLCYEIERHLAECENCRVVVDTTRRTVEIVHDACGEDVIPGEVKSRLFACLHLPIPEHRDLTGNL